MAIQRSPYGTVGMDCRGAKPPWMTRSLKRVRLFTV